MSELYAVCDRDGDRWVAPLDGVPLFNQRGDCKNIKFDDVLLYGDRCSILPDFPKPESYKKIKRLSLLPLEIEYEDPPVELKIWACTDARGSRTVMNDLDGYVVEYVKGDNGYWRGGELIAPSRLLLHSIPGWPPPGERREISSIEFHWADEGK